MTALADGAGSAYSPAQAGYPTVPLAMRSEPEMLQVPPASKRLRVLLSEGASTSAREAITILGITGHLVEVCDPDAHCLARFSRFVSRFHRCPGLARDPAGFLTFIETLLKAQRFDVLLPIHEQGFLL